MKIVFVDAALDQQRIVLTSLALLVCCLLQALAVLLLDKSEMLTEYFGVSFAAEPGTGTIRLTHLPRLLDGHCPEFSYLPEFVVALASSVDWTSEMECFHGVSAVLADLYSQLRYEDDADTLAPTNQNSVKWITRCVCVHSQMC